MGKVRFINSEKMITDRENVIKFLSSENIMFGQFELTNYALDLAKKETATDDERITLINEYQDLINKYSQMPGYRADVVFLHPGFPYYKDLIIKFGDIHYHFENEYWYFIGGHYDFCFLGSNGWKYAVTVSAGEYLSVPEGKWQWLEGTIEQQMKAIRFFNSTGHYKQLPITDIK